MAAFQSIEFSPELLTDPKCYPHEVAAVELIETHLSWVYLAGEYAYKVKKPLSFDFVDFKTLERRKFFCLKELELNRRFAPELYIDVVPILPAHTGVVIGERNSSNQSSAVEWAVKMHRFGMDAEVKSQLAHGCIGAEDFYDYGCKIVS